MPASPRDNQRDIVTYGGNQVGGYTPSRRFIRHRSANDGGLMGVADVTQETLSDVVDSGTCDATVSVVASDAVVDLGSVTATIAFLEAETVVDVGTATAVVSLADTEVLIDTGTVSTTISLLKTETIVEPTGTVTATAAVTDTEAISEGGIVSSTGGVTGGDALVDAATCTAVASVTDSEKLVDSGSVTASVSLTETDLIADAGTVTAVVSLTETDGVIFVDSGTATVVVSLLDSEKLIDQGTVDTTVSLLKAETLVESTGIVTATTSAIAADAPADAGSSTTTGSFIAGEAIADAGTTTAVSSATDTEALLDSGTVTAVMSLIETDKIADLGTCTTTISLTDVETILDSGTCTAVVSLLETDGLADSGTCTAVVSLLDTETIADTGTATAVISLTETDGIVGGNVSDSGTVTTTISLASVETIIEPAGVCTAATSCSAADKFAESGSINVYIENERWNRWPYGGFEVNGQVGFSSYGGATLTQTSAEHADGAKSLQVDVPAGANAGGRGTAANVQLPTESGRVWTSQIRVKAPAGVAYEIGLEYGSVAGYAGGDYRDFVGTGAWVTHQFTSTPPPTTTYVNPLGVRVTDGTACAVYIDAIMIELGSVATAYIDTNGSIASAPISLEAIVDPTGVCTAVASITGSDAPADSGTCSSTCSLTDTEKLVDAGTTTATTSVTAVETIADKGTVTGTISVVASDAPADSGTCSSTGSVTAGEAITDSGTVSTVGSFTSVEVIRDSGIVDTVISVSGVGVSAGQDAGNCDVGCTVSAGETIVEPAGICTAVVSLLAADARADSGAVTTFVQNERVNLFPYGGFEIDTSGWGAAANSSIARTAAWSKFGGFGALVSTTVRFGSAFFATPLPVQPNTTYVASVYVSRRETTDDWDVRIANQISLPIANTAVPKALGDQRVTVVFKTGPNDTGVYFNMQNNTVTVDPIGIYIDAVQIELGSVASPYIDTNGAIASAPLSLEAIVDPTGICTAAVSVSGADVPADAGTTGVNGSFTAGEALLDSGTVTGATSTTSVEKLVDQGTVSATVSTTSADAVADSGAATATISVAATGFRNPEIDSGTCTLVVSPIGADAIPSAGTATVIVSATGVGLAVAGTFITPTSTIYRDPVPVSGVTTAPQPESSPAYYVRARGMSWRGPSPDSDVWQSADPASKVDRA